MAPYIFYDFEIQNLLNDPLLSKQDRKGGAPVVPVVRTFKPR